MAWARWNNVDWTTYTPELTATTTNPNLGTSPTKTGYYAQFGKLVIGRFYIKFGTGASVSAGSGTYIVSMPVTPRNADNAIWGTVYLGDNSATESAMAVVAVSGNNSAQMVYPLTYPKGTSWGVGNSSPWTWAANDTLQGNFAYEAA